MDSSYNALLFLVAAMLLIRWLRRKPKCDCDIFPGNKNYELIDHQEKMRQQEENRKREFSFNDKD